VVDLVDPTGSPLSVVAEGVVALAGRLGLDAVATGTVDAARLLVERQRHRTDAAAVILPPQVTPRRPARRLPAAWQRAAHLTRTLRRADTPVLAVGFGAAALTVAACAEQGAVPVLDSAALHAALTAFTRRSWTPALTAARSLPDPYRAILGLTAGERTVLHLMTEGLSAAEMAELLVVNVATVRSHVRSILRKLGVHSQLEAVGVMSGSPRSRPEAAWGLREMVG